MKKYATTKKAQPSFSCKGKLNRIKTAICNSDGLSIYDRELNENYKHVLGNSNITTDLKASQTKWIKRRHNKCDTFAENDKFNACLARTTRARIRYLEYVQSAFNKQIN